MKKDILAAITFIATGLLFYVVRSDTQATSTLLNIDDCGAAETVLLKHTVPASTELQIVLVEDITRDS